MSSIFPPIPPWDALHVQVVHFPIALLIVAPIFVAIDLFMAPRTRAYGYSALLLLCLGTIGAFVAVFTGGAAAEVVPLTPEISQAIEHHAELAETARTVYAILTLLYAGALFGPALLRKKMRIEPRVSMAARGILLALLLASSALLANAAHAGGVLVHVFGVRAQIEAPQRFTRTRRTRSEITREKREKQRSNERRSH